MSAVITQNDVECAIELAKEYNVEPWVAKQILRKAGLSLPTKKAQVSITLDVELPDGMALYKSNLEVSERNGIPVKVNVDDDDNCLLTN